LVVEKQVPDSFADRRLVVGDADVTVFDCKLGGSSDGVATRDFEGVAE